MTHYTMGLHDRGGEQIRLLHPLPGARVTQGYGPSTIAYPNWDGHAGVDYSAVVGTPVRAAHDGRCYPGDQGAAGWGRYVTIRALDGACETIYAHLSTVLVNYRDRVAAGQVIGGTGNTGRSTGPHLHFGLRPLPADWDNGYSGWVDPVGYFVEEGDMTDEERERIVTARWNAEEAVREIERIIETLHSARDRLVNETIPKLYAAEGQGT